MKQLIIVSCVFLYALCTFAHPTPASTTNKPKLLGSKECTWGPSYWCSNITNAKSCNAVSHCIQTVWEHRKVPEDNDDVCQICVKMVKQARDQLESNETQEELKQVFEGSCNLIPLKIIARECDKLVDDFVPELVETLASQMNPQSVCTVAGLCNNARIDKLLAEQAEKLAETTTTTTAIVKKQDDCQGCHTVVGKLQAKFSTMTKDQVLQGILNVCGRMSSLSDACTNIVITYFSEIYAHLQENLNPDEVCLLAGVCTAQFHTHENKNIQIENVEITPLSDMGRVNIATKDDLPCELCEQLVKHLRDLLVANTTELEFQHVLEGLCSQTKTFKDECKSLVDQYYPEMYQFLMSELNSNTVCVMVGICQKSQQIDASPEFAMLPPETARKSVQIMSAIDHSRLTGQDEKNSYKPKVGNVEIIQNGAEVQVSHPELVQLPIERLNPISLTLNGNTQLCTFCEYFLHFIQEEITKPKTEDKIKKIVSGACEKLPRAIVGQCEEFVEMYGDAFVALLVQELDPSQICPLLSLCPSAGVQEVEILMHSKPEDKPNCPLCLFAVTQLEDMIKNHKTKESIQNALDKLCSHLPKNLASECEDFVQTYSNELIEMLIADLSPQEVCVYLKLCDDQAAKRTQRPMLSPQLIHRPESMQVNGGDWTITNEIPDNTVEGRITGTSEITKERSPQCVVCKFVISQIERELKDRTSEEEVKRIVHGVCNHLPKDVGKKCNDFVDKYGDAIIKLIVFTMEPARVCESLLICASNIVRVQEEILDCAICETTVTALDKLLNNPKIDHAMEHVLKKACLALSTQHQQKCKAMIDTYGDSFFHLVTKLSDAKAVCHKVGLCSGELFRPQRQTLLGEKKCTWGPSYWCSSTTTADECNARDHCMEKYWKGTPPQ